MPVIVNGVELSDADMERELPHHQDSPEPMKHAMTALVLRRVLLDEAARLACAGEDEEALISALLEREVQVPVATEDECRRFFDANPARFVVGELVEASHILFQVTPQVDLEALRARALAVLDQLKAEPARFAELAKANSNCPSGEVGGSLGQLSRGQTVPEFEQVLFALAEGEIYPQLLETRFGLHIVRQERKAAGRALPFEQVQARIGEALNAASQDRALQQYLKLLLGRAKIEGIDLEGADTPLVQ